jgi:hypothetical protein
VRLRAFQAEYEGSIPFTRSNLFLDHLDAGFMRAALAGAWRLQALCGLLFPRPAIPTGFVSSLPSSRLSKAGSNIFSAHCTAIDGCRYA